MGSSPIPGMGFQLLCKNVQMLLKSIFLRPSTAPLQQSPFKSQLWGLLLFCYQHGCFPKQCSAIYADPLLREIHLLYLFPLKGAGGSTCFLGNMGLPLEFFNPALADFSPFLISPTSSPLPEEQDLLMQARLAQTCKGFSPNLWGKIEESSLPPPPLAFRTGFQTGNALTGPPQPVLPTATPLYKRVTHVPHPPCSNGRHRLS